MDNLLKYPQSTIVNRVVPKAMFYKFMDVSPRMKTRFVNDVVNITWLYKLSAATLHVADSDDMKEIEVFAVNLKQPDCPTDLFAFIDTNMPHHIVFILIHENDAMLLVNYKEWANDAQTRFRITQAFFSPWKPISEISLKVEGQSLPRVYDNFVAQVSGIGEHKAGTMAEIVALKKQIAADESALLTLEKKMRREPQLDVQMRMNKLVKAKRQQIESLKLKMEELSI